MLHSLIAEFLGTALMILFGVGVHCDEVLTKTKYHGSGHIFAITTWAFGISVTLFIFGGVCINPAMALCQAILGMIPWSNFIPYCIAEFLGALFGSLVVYVMYADHFKASEGKIDPIAIRNIFSTNPNCRNLPRNFFVETIARAIEGEMERQIDLIEDGKKVVQETRRWDDDKEYSYPMRSKEDAQDYRYFPEPDLTPIVISDEWLDEIRSRQPEFRDEKQARYKEQFGLPEYDINIITEDKTLTDLFESCIELGAAAKEVSNWIMGDIMRLLKEKEMEASDIHFSPANLVKMIQMIESGAINRKVAKKVFEAIFDEDVDPEVYVEENGLKTVNDEGALRKVIEEIVANNPKSVEDYKAGKKKAMGFFVGQTMRAMKGKADPAMVNQILKEMLD